MTEQQLNAAKRNALKNQNQFGYQNPVFSTEASASAIMTSIDSGYIDSRDSEAVAREIEAKSIGSMTTITIDEASSRNGASGEDDAAWVRRARFARQNSMLTSQEVDILLCDRVFTVKTRTYVNFKKSLQMLKPFGVLLFLILILIFLFRVDVFVSSAGTSNPDEN